MTFISSTGKVNIAPPVGDDRFCQQIEEKYGIGLRQCARGRQQKRGLVKK
jgi:hypothetical protein